MMPSCLEDYEVLSTIGTGSYGTCRKVKRKRDGKVLVWKELDYGSMSEAEKQLLVSEVNLLRELRHGHIVRYYDRIIDRHTSTLYIVMEYCEGGDLGSLINILKKEGGYVEEDVVWKIAVQLIAALSECHGRAKNGKIVLHRDLKPANVFLDSQHNVKLGDFGLARVLNHETSFAQTYVGTPYYMSPEQMNCRAYNEKSDVWSLGCLLYELCALRPPFTASSLRDLALRINSGRHARLPVRYSEELDLFVRQLLQVEGERRPRIDKLLQHRSVLSRIDRFYSVPTARPVSSSGGDDERILPPRPLSAASDYGSLTDLIKKREVAVTQREVAVAEKEETLDKKERDLQSKEKELEMRERALVLRSQDGFKYRQDKRFSALDPTLRCVLENELLAPTPNNTRRTSAFQTPPALTPITLYDRASRCRTDVKQDPRKALFHRRNPPQS